MSHLGDLIVAQPFTGPLLSGGFGDDDELTDWRELNALRDELIELRALRRVELTHEVQQAFLEKLIQIREDNKAATCIEALVAALRAAGLEVVGNAPGAAPSATLPAERPPAKGAARVEPSQRPETGCDCGHDGLDPMFHLAPRPIAEQRRRERAAPTPGCGWCQAEGYRCPPCTDWQNFDGEPSPCTPPTEPCGCMHFAGQQVVTCQGPHTRGYGPTLRWADA